MAIVVPDVVARLKPELLQTVQIIYRDFCNLTAGEKVLIISDARTPESLVAVFHGVAMMMGADAVVIEGAIPSGGATYQPSVKWSPMIVAAAEHADLIIDMAVGYADFIVRAVGRGARVYSPGDGIAMPYTDEVLIRTILHTDLAAMSRRAKRVADHFTRARTCKMVTGDCVLEMDIADLAGRANDNFLWDKEQQKFTEHWAFAPGAQPGIHIPAGRANGEVLVDGTLLYHPVYHEAPATPLRLGFEHGRLVDIGGDPLLSGRLRDWLERLGDDGAWEGPVHLNIGVNPNALLSQHPEWERVLGSVTCGMGDLSMLSAMEPEMTANVATSGVHWDWTTLRPTIILDDVTLVREGIMNSEVC